MSTKTKYTTEELAEAMVFPVKLTARQRKEAAEQLAAARKISAQEETEEDRLSLKLFQLRFHLEDYVNGKKYEPEKHFGHFLKRYIEILGIKRKAFAEDISIDETMLSQYINMHRTPPDYVSIRLELHSNNIIPAEYWYRLVEMQKEYQIRTDKALRKKERKFVHKLAITL